MTDETKAAVTASETPWTAGDILRDTALAAADKLEEMGHEFCSPHFTDRYGDGPEMLQLAKDIRAALHRANPALSAGEKG